MTGGLGRRWRRWAILPAALIGLCLTHGASFAQSGPCDSPQGPPTIPDNYNWNGGNYLLGDMGGFRSKAQQSGINFCLQYNTYLYQNAVGGLARGPVAQGQIFSWVDVDLGKLTRSDALASAYFHAAIYSMQGQSFSTKDVGLLSTATFTDQLTTTRLGSVWFEKQFLDGKLTVRAGQLGIDDEFLLSPTASTFINSTFGFPGWMGSDLPGGGAAYPLEGPGARLKYSLSDAVTLMGGVFTGDPAGRSNPVPQLANRYGTTFNLNGGALMLGEAAYSTAYPNSGVDLPGTYKVGAWYETGNRFNDLRFDVNGLPLASPASNGMARTYNSDWGVYGIIDQTLLAGDKDGLHKLAGFARVGASPSNRNLVDFYVDGGLTFTGAIPGRPTDLVGLGAAIDRISSAASGFDRDQNAFGATPPTPVRDHEITLESFYTINVSPWLAIDLDVQRIVHPGGNVLATTGMNVGQRVRDATLYGVNTQIKF